jgi:predicted transcriptional regulator
MNAKPRAKRSAGRPPAGVRRGEMVREYPQVSLRLPPEMKAKLQGLALVSSTPQWRVVSAALECFFRERSRAEQRDVLAAMVRGRAAARRLARHK